MGNLETKPSYQMAFLRRRNPNSEKRDWKGAIGDAAIVFFVTLFANLAGYGYPPTPQTLYTSAITAALMFFISVQRTLKIESPER